jgi:hypothetical protein
MKGICSKGTSSSSRIAGRRQPETYYGSRRTGEFRLLTIPEQIKVNPTKSNHKKNSFFFEGCDSFDRGDTEATHALRWIESTAVEKSKSPTKFLLLPKGEGRDEGEGDDRLPVALNYPRAKALANSFGRLTVVTRDPRAGFCNHSAARIVKAVALNLEHYE